MGVFTTSINEFDDGFTRQKGKSKSKLQTLMIPLAVFAWVTLVIASINFVDNKMEEINAIEEAEFYQTSVLNLQEGASFD